MRVASKLTLHEIHNYAKSFRQARLTGITPIPSVEHPNAFAPELDQHALDPAWAEQFPSIDLKMSVDGRVVDAFKDANPDKPVYMFLISEDELEGEFADAVKEIEKQVINAAKEAAKTA
jgi:hypothetical protein